MASDPDIVRLLTQQILDVVVESEADNALGALMTALAHEIAAARTAEDSEDLRANVALWGRTLSILADCPQGRIGELITFASS